MSATRAARLALGAALLMLAACIDGGGGTPTDRAQSDFPGPNLQERNRPPEFVP